MTVFALFGSKNNTASKFQPVQPVHYSSELQNARYLRFRLVQVEVVDLGLALLLAVQHELGVCVKIQSAVGGRFFRVEFSFKQLAVDE